MRKRIPTAMRRSQRRAFENSSESENRSRRFIVTSTPARPRIALAHANVNHATSVPISLRDRVRSLGPRFLQGAIAPDCVDRNSAALASPAFSPGKNELETSPTPGGIKHVTSCARPTPQTQKVSTFHSRERKPSSADRGLDPAGVERFGSPSKSNTEGSVSNEESLVHNASDQGGPR
jgi:hypothetical protein